MKTKLVLGALSLGALVLSSAAVTHAATAEGSASMMKHFQKNTTGMRGLHLPFEKGDSLAGVLKLTPEELKNQLKEGKTISQIAEAKGISKEQLTQYFETQHQKMLSDIKNKLTKQVTSGKITQGEMDKKLAVLANKKGGFDQLNHFKMGQGLKPPSEKLANFLGMKLIDLETALQSGKKLEVIASGQGKTTADLTSFFEAEKQARVEMVKAKLAEEVKNGVITQEQMNQRVENITHHVNKQPFKKVLKQK
jgi:DNA-directed RNA polymerase specialized sigma subunit